MMTLFLNETSPYARVIRILLLKINLAEQTELCWCDPWNKELIYHLAGLGQGFIPTADQPFRSRFVMILLINKTAQGKQGHP